MKLLVFAHVPPPHHGQSYMVQQLLDGLRAREASLSVHCLHVDVRYSDDAADIGALRLGKVLRLPYHCAHAIALRLTTGVRTLYFVPAPPRRVPVLRDVATLLLLRPFFPHLVLHWHASGLGSWLQSQPRWLRLPAQRLLGRADLSISLARYSEEDAKLLAPKQSIIVPYGIDDPFPSFSEQLAPRRRARAQTIARDEAARVRVLFLALCTREKGLFDALDAVAAANQQAARRGARMRFELHVAGAFASADEEAEVAARVASPDWRDLYHHHGFLGAARKRALLEQSDVMLFPTFYSAESFPVVVLEAMAAGLPIVTTLFRALPEMLPASYPGLVRPGDVPALAEKLVALSASPIGLDLRSHYVAHYTLDGYLTGMAAALASMEPT